MAVHSVVLPLPGMPMNSTTMGPPAWRARVAVAPASDLAVGPQGRQLTLLKTHSAGRREAPSGELDLVSEPSVQDGMGSDHAVLDLVQRVAISPSDGEAVGDHDDRGLARKTVNGLHHRRLGVVVEGAGGLVQHQQGRAMV